MDSQSKLAVALGATVGLGIVTDPTQRFVERPRSYGRPFPRPEPEDKAKTKRRKKNKAAKKARRQNRK